MKINRNSSLAHILSVFTAGTLFKLKKNLGFMPKTPFMKFREISILEQLLLNLKPTKCLEYGSGYSSNYFIDYLPKTATWKSVEHDKNWYNEVLKNLLNQRVDIHLVPPDNDLNENLEDPKPFGSYINYPSNSGPFDFILVDGMVRVSCIEKAKELLNESGVLIVHDANKKLYQDALIENFPHYVILQDYRRSSGGVGIATNNDQIKNLINLKLHIRTWKIVSLTGSILKFKWLIGRPLKKFNLIESK